MARYQPIPGEVELFKETVETRYDKRRSGGTLLVTDRRVVLIATPPPSFAAIFGLGVGGAVLEKLLGRAERIEQIDRHDFDTVEHVERVMLSFRSTGEGYGHISFIVYTRTPFAVWRQRMEQWASGAPASAPSTRT